MNLYRKLRQYIVADVKVRSEHVGLTKKGEAALEKMKRGEAVYGKNAIDPRERYILTRKDGLKLYLRKNF